MTTDPSRFDVIVTDNLFGDIITDLAAAITGGIGLAASGNINPDRTAPSMFEPVHGSAPDIAGQQKADPTAAILSVSLLLDHLGLRRRRCHRGAGRPGRPRRTSTRGVPGAPLRSATPSPPAYRAEFWLPDSPPGRGIGHLLAVTTPDNRQRTPRSPSREPREEEVGYRASYADQHHPLRPTRSPTPGSPRSWPTPASACTSPTTCSPSSGPPTQGWHDARITPYGPLSLDPATAVLHYAQEIFEGMKAYRHDDGSIWTFRPEVQRRADGALLRSGWPCRRWRSTTSCRPSTS